MIEPTPEVTPEVAPEVRPIAGVRYTCRGPLVLSPALLAAAQAKREKLKGDHAMLHAFAKNLAASMGHADKLPAEAADASVTDVEEQLVRLVKARKGCGYDKTALVEAVPFDGVEHKITCPACGTVDPVMRTPRTPDEAAAAAAAKEATLADLLK